jgi:hypothetical protein
VNLFSHSSTQIVEAKVKISTYNRLPSPSEGVQLYRVLQKELYKCCKALFETPCIQQQSIDVFLIVAMVAAIYVTSLHWLLIHIAPLLFQVTVIQGVSKRALQQL